MLETDKLLELRQKCFDIFKTLKELTPEEKEQFKLAGLERGKRKFVERTLWNLIFAINSIVNPKKPEDSA